MKIRTILRMVLLLAAVGNCAEFAQTGDVIPLWKQHADSPNPVADVNVPILIPYLPQTQDATDCAVIICPGGGYQHLAMDHEGRQIAEWFNAIGISAFILKYRLPGDGFRYPVPLMDAQRAIRLVRSRAEQWNIHPGKIGILGFSAGGHLASSAGTHFEDPVIPQESDTVNDISCRPDFMILVYPVISMKEGITHGGSRRNLLGKNPAPELIELMSNEKQATSRTPPTFLVHADDDEAVLPENSILFYEACRRVDVPAEMHIFLKGGHGFGIRPTAGPVAQWPQLCRQWLQQQSFLEE